eukprot:3473980-Rhodomonas_salina.1
MPQYHLTVTWYKYTHSLQVLVRPALVLTRSWLLPCKCRLAGSYYTLRLPHSPEQYTGSSTTTGAGTNEVVALGVEVSLLVFKLLPLLR